MAESKKASPLNPPFGMCSVPARSPGILGLNDAGNPDLLSLLGNTPGPLGWNDFADPTLRAIFGMSGVSLGTPLRLADGTPVSAGSTAQMQAAGAAPKKITLAMLKAADKSNTDEYYKGILDAMNEYAETYEVNTPLRIAHFLAQIGHESGFRVIEENGSYSAKRMREVFGCKGGRKNYDAAKDDCTLGQLRSKLWTEETTYTHKPQELLSYAYASRYGNGDEVSGDGYTYRGRGMIQLTFKDNYAAFTKAHNKKNPTDVQDFVANPDLLVTSQKYGVASAFYFWYAKGLNAKADTDKVTDVTIGVNGGTNGLADREARLNNVRSVLGI